MSIIYVYNEENHSVNLKMSSIVRVPSSYLFFLNVNEH